MPPRPPSHSCYPPPWPVAGAPLKPLGWAETSPPPQLHGERRPLHTPPLDRGITLFSSSLGCRNPPRSPPMTTRLLHRRTPPPVFSSTALSMPGHLGEPPSSSPCQVPPSSTTGASLIYPTAFHPPLGRRRPCYGTCRARGDNATGVHRYAG
jgi:hypothetical protein